MATVWSIRRIRSSKDGAEGSSSEGSSKETDGEAVETEGAEVEGAEADSAEKKSSSDRAEGICGSSKKADEAETVETTAAPVVDTPAKPAN